MENFPLIAIIGFIDCIIFACILFTLQKVNNSIRKLQKITTTIDDIIVQTVMEHREEIAPRVLSTFKSFCNQGMNISTALQEARKLHDK